MNQNQEPLPLPEEWAEQIADLIIAGITLPQAFEMAKIKLAREEKKEDNNDSRSE